VSGAGLLTLVFAAYVAVFKHDLKGLLAYSTISHLGLIVFLIGLNSPLSARWRGVPHPEPRHLQGLAVHDRRHHRPRDRHAATCGAWAA
jgi:NADH:ubiquinone oxidoreductase subunit 5 (subunit L)/multisubunit Na+/H+ antiporter MnhA subunit